MVFLEHGTDAGVIEVKGIPEAPAVIGFGVDQGGVFGDEVEFVVRVFQEIADIAGDFEPGGVDAFHHLQHTLRRTADAPVVFEAHRHAALFGRGQALLEAVDDPLEALFIGMAFGGFLHAAMGHQIVKILAGAPGAGLDAHGGDAERVGLFEAEDRVFDVFAALVGIGREEGLVSGKTVQIQAVREGVSLELLQVGEIIIFKLHLKDINAIKTPLGGQLDALFDAAVMGIAELPKRVGGQPDAKGSRHGGWSGGRGFGDADERCGEGGCGDDGVGEKISAGVHRGSPWRMVMR